VWASSPLAARWIAGHAALLEGRDVLELGAGCGLSGLAAALCAAPRSVVLSDYAPDTLANLLYNVARNCQRADGRAAGGGGGVAAGATPVPPVSVELGGVRYGLGDAFTSRTGARVTLAQLDWDAPSTWPRAGGGEGGGGDDAGVGADAVSSGDGVPPHARYDVLLMTDVVYRRSYARKVAGVVEGLLRPGGLVLVATPTAREGLPTLDRMMAAAGFTADEEPMPDEWRVSPLRAPGAGMLAGLGLARLGLRPVGLASVGVDEGEEGGKERAYERALLARAAAEGGDGGGEGGGGELGGALRVPLEAVDGSGAPAGQLHLVPPHAARGMFPELDMPNYGIVMIRYHRKAPEGEPTAS
jgi:predicted nicotinamide N-methyase